MTTPTGTTPTGTTPTGTTPTGTTPTGTTPTGATPTGTTTAGPATAGPASPAVPRPGALLKRSGVLAASALPPIIFGAAVLLAWEGFVRWRDIQPIVLPAPSAIVRAMGHYGSDIAAAAAKTGLNALVGLVVGTALAVIAASLAARLRFVDELITPLAAAVATMPIVVSAPLFNFMFNSTSNLPRRLVVVVSVFVPVFVNTARGLKRLSPVHAELMASLAASGTDTLRTVRIPGALPYFFTGVRIAASLAVISAVVAEYFGGLQDGLGPKINSSVATSDTAVAWAYVMGAVALGLIFYAAAAAIEWLAMRARTAIVN